MAGVWNTSWNTISIRDLVLFDGYHLQCFISLRSTRRNIISKNKQTPFYSVFSSKVGNKKTHTHTLKQQPQRPPLSKASPTTSPEESLVDQRILALYKASVELTEAISCEDHGLCWLWESLFGSLSVFCFNGLFLVVFVV